MPIEWAEIRIVRVVPQNCSPLLESNASGVRIGNQKICTRLIFGNAESYPSFGVKIAKKSVDVTNAV